MKQLTVFVYLLVAVYGSLPQDVIQGIRQYMITLGVECIDEVGASDADIIHLIGYKLPETEKGKCFIACMHKQLGIMNKSGKIDKMGWYNVLDKLKTLDIDTYKLIKPVCDKCVVEVTNSDNECDTAVNLLKCLYEEGNCGNFTSEQNKCIFEF